MTPRSARDDLEVAGTAAQLEGVVRGVPVDAAGGEAGAAANRVERLVIRESELSLPWPRGTSTLRLSGGASRVAVIRRPRRTAAPISVRGGASNLSFDAQRLGAVGGATRLSTPGWDTAPDRWSIELTGGASDLSVVEE